MNSSHSILDTLSVASPCHADWNQMSGTEQVRFCGDCKLNVYNLSGMTRTDAESLILEKEGKLCVRFFRRADGTILTRDCPVGIQALHRRKVRMVLKRGATAAVLLMSALGSFTLLANADDTKGGASASPSVKGEATLGDVMQVETGKPMHIEPTMGNMVMPSQVKGQQNQPETPVKPPCKLKKKNKKQPDPANP